jgi:hypothetical protein
VFGKPLLFALHNLRVLRQQVCFLTIQQDAEGLINHSRPLGGAVRRVVCFPNDIAGKSRRWIKTNQHRSDLPVTSGAGFGLGDQSAHEHQVCALVSRLCGT